MISGKTTRLRIGNRNIHRIEMKLRAIPLSASGTPFEWQPIFSEDANPLRATEELIRRAAWPVAEMIRGQKA